MLAGFSSVLMHFLDVVVHSLDIGRNYRFDARFCLDGRSSLLSTPATGEPLGQCDEH
jgi:hypothetical protein